MEMCHAVHGTYFRSNAGHQANIENCGGQGSIRGFIHTLGYPFISRSILSNRRTANIANAATDSSCRVFLHMASFENGRRVA